MKIKTLALGASALVCLGIIVDLVSRTTTPEVPFPANPSNQQQPQVPPKSESSQVPTSDVKKSQTSPQEISSHSSVKQQPTPDFKYKKELERFVHIKGKALLKPEDKSAKAKLLQNAELILSLKPLLLTAATDEQSTHLQNAAVDFLMEALEQKDTPAEVFQVLRDVVADGSIEDKSRALKDRQALAEVKAEVLYQWSSRVPASESDILGALPGPVSKKIWTNVKQQQENNLAESATLQSQ